MITIYTRGWISASHRLNLPYDSKCRREHGHNYKVEIWVEGTRNENGMVVDFTDLKKILRSLDHQNLNDFLPQPTAENLAIYIANAVKSIRRDVTVTVRVWETHNNYAEVYLSNKRDDNESK